MPWSQYVEIGLGHFGWTPAVFWDTSLAEFLLALKGYQRKQQDQYWHTGEIVAAFYNVNRDSKARPEPYRADDIFPFLLTFEERLERKWAQYNARIEAEEDQD